MHGGAGAIISAGLLRHLNVSLYQRCVTGQEARSGGPDKCNGKFL